MGDDNDGSTRISLDPGDESEDTPFQRLTPVLRRYPSEEDDASQRFPPGHLTFRERYMIRLGYQPFSLWVSTSSIAIAFAKLFIPAAKWKSKGLAPEKFAPRRP